MTPEIENSLMSHPSGFYARLSYFECGDGWASILRQLATEVSELPSKPPVFAVQVKEKFGGLRIYISSDDDGWFPEVDKLVVDAEKSSLSVCEQCGNKGERRSKSYWIQTLCDVHMYDKGAADNEPPG